jgi:hypothetical protein
VHPADSPPTLPMHQPASQRTHQQHVPNHAALDPSGRLAGGGGGQGPLAARALLAAAVLRWVLPTGWCSTCLAPQEQVGELHPP